MIKPNKRDQSIAEGDLVNLYEFSLGNNERFWRYCSADKDIELNHQTFIATAISDSGRRGQDNIHITVPFNHDIALLFRGRSPSLPLKVRILRWHYGDEIARVVWVGTIVEVKRPETHKVELISAGLSATMNSAGLRLSWCRSCPYALYDTDCTVNPERHCLKNLTVESVEGNSVFIKGLIVKDGQFNGGFMEWIDLFGIREVVAIRQQVGNKVQLIGSSVKLNIGQKVKLYPGCDGMLNTCRDKFNNLANFGGIPHMPEKSPYDGSRVF